MSQVIRELPDGYERVDHHDTLTLHNEERGIVISVIERDETDRQIGKWPYKVSVAQNQHPLYQGVFDSESHAEDKAFEKAAEL